MSNKPTLVFVPGAWHNISTWDKVVSRLETQQYKCVRVVLPSTASDPSATLLDDITAVRNAIEAEIAKELDVVLIVHSYGGAVGVSAIKGLTSPKAEVSTTSGNLSENHVIGIVSMASGFGSGGLSFVDGLGGKPPPSWKADEESGFAVLVADPREMFYHDLSVEEGNYWVDKLEKQSLKALFEGGEHAYAGWMDVPVWYLATTEDKAFPIFAQKLMAKMAKDAGANITVRDIACSHSPMLSKPEETANFILEAVASFVQ